MNTIFHPRIIRGLVATSILGGAIAASLSVSAAGAENHSVSKLVKFDDLNISTPAGAAELYGRIDAAAATVCSYFWFRSDKDEARCLRDAIANAVAEVNEPALVTVYRLKNREPLPVPRVASHPRK